MKLALCLAFVAACGGGTSSTVSHNGPTPPTLTVEQFQKLAVEVATRTGAKVITWGQADLADDDHEVRFAVLENQGTSEGTYLLSSRGKLYAILFDVDGKTQAWGGRDNLWVKSADKRIAHRQAHRAGFEDTEVALRAGKIVVLRTAYLDDARTSDQPEEREFPCDPVCTPFAPGADTYGLKNPRGPASTIDELFPRVK
jgi:hypothetical protein